MRQLLAEVYGWFTEGFDMAYRKDAKALIDDLSNIQVALPLKVLSHRVFTEREL